MEFNNDKVATNYPNVSYFNKKGFKALFLEDSFAIESFGRLRNVSLDKQYSNPNLITDLINTSLILNNVILIIYFHLMILDLS